MHCCKLWHRKELRPSTVDGWVNKCQGSYHWCSCEQRSKHRWQSMPTWWYMTSSYRLLPDTSPPSLVWTSLTQPTRVFRMSTDANSVSKLVSPMESKIADAELNDDRFIESNNGRVFSQMMLKYWVTIDDRYWVRMIIEYYVQLMIPIDWFLSVQLFVLLFLSSLQGLKLSVTSQKINQYF